MRNMPSVVVSKVVLAVILLAIAVSVAAAIVLPDALLGMTLAAVDGHGRLPVDASPGPPAYFNVTVGGRETGVYISMLHVSLPSRYCADPVLYRRYMGLGKALACCDGLSCTILYVPRVDVDGGTVHLWLATSAGPGRRVSRSDVTLAVLHLDAPADVYVNGTRMGRVGPGEVAVEATIYVYHG